MAGFALSPYVGTFLYLWLAGLFNPAVPGGGGIVTMAVFSNIGLLPAVPLYALFRWKRWRQWWQVMLAGALVGLFYAVLFAYGNGASLARGAGFLGGWGAMCGIVFWLIAVWRNPAHVSRKSS